MKSERLIGPPLASPALRIGSRSSFERLQPSKKFSNSHSLRVRKAGLPPLFEFVSLPLMARKWSNQNLPGALHYVTGNFLDRIPVFNQEVCCQSFIDTFSTLLGEWPCKLIAYVLMPDHLHLIVNPQDGRIKEFTGKLKSLSARAITKTARGIDFKLDSEGSLQVWQESFKAIPLWSPWMIWQKINYIHANPVKARLVTSAKGYRWSSFQAFYSGSDKPLKVDQEWWWPDDSEKLSKAVKELGWRTYNKRN